MGNKAMNQYDAILMVSFGGPEGRDDVIPFLENVLRGKNVPRERLLAVAEHYYHFDGVSPINAQNRALIAALEGALVAHDIDLPIYWGNRNWYPLLTDTMQQMKQDGVQHALTFFTSAYSSYSGCRQYLEDIARAQESVGKNAPQVSLLRKFYNHPGFIHPNVEHVQAALAQIPAERRAAAQVVFTAHSIPLTMARNSMYEAQLRETCRLVAQRAGIADWKLVYQSRSGSPHQPWLEPDILEHLRTLKAEGSTDVVIAPIGFISDHMEVLYDLDTEAQQLGQEIGLNIVRAATVGTHPQFIDMICELIIERMTGRGEKSFLGTRGASHDVCPSDCCLLSIEQASKAKVEPA
jgi:protoporphyrin/coproporphyrin ferrochelatase